MKSINISQGMKWDEKNFININNYYLFRSLKVKRIALFSLSKNVETGFDIIHKYTR